MDRRVTSHGHQLPRGSRCGSPAAAAASTDDAADLLLLLPPLLDDDDGSTFEVLDLLGFVEPAAAAAAAECSLLCPSASGSSEAGWEATGPCTGTGALVGSSGAVQRWQRRPCGTVGHCATASSLDWAPPGGSTPDRSSVPLPWVSGSVVDGAKSISATAAAAVCDEKAGDSCTLASSVDRAVAAGAGLDRPEAEPSCGGRSRLVCSVCGDHARGHNFGAIACESCKAFFRRTVQKSKVARCQFDGDCVQTVKTRRFCSACRLDRCLKAGMNKSLVRGEEEKSRLRGISKCNKEKKKLVEAVASVTSHRSASERSSSCGRSSSEPPDATLPPSTISQPLTGMPTPDHATDLHVTAASTGDAQMASAALEEPSLSRSQSFVAAALDELRQGRRSAELELSRQLQQLSTSLAEDVSLQRYMSALQWAELIELGRRYSSAQPEGAGVPSYKTGTSAAVQQTTGSDAVAQHASSFIRRFVAFSRELPEFSRLPLKLQMHLLKAGSAAFLTIRSAETYCPAAGCWFDDQGHKIPREIMSTLGSTSDSARHTLHVEMVEAIRQQLPVDAGGCIDIIVVALLQIIVLLSPENLLGTAATASSSLADVSDAQQHYIVLLRHYIEAKYSYTLAAELVPELIRLLSLCKRTAHHLNATLLATEAVRDDPLLHEVLEP